MLATGSLAGEISSKEVIGCSLENTMAFTMTFTSDKARSDAKVFCERAARVYDGSARLIATGDVLQAYVGVLFPRGLLDQTPTVLGLRVFALGASADFDAVVPLESLIHRLGAAAERNELEVAVPAEVASLAWAAITPPREGWRRRLGIPAQALSEAAASGVSAVAAAVPESIGESALQKVRAQVWGAPIANHARIPSSAAFAADALGFLSERTMQVHTVGNWLRLSSKAGYIVVKTAGSAL